MQSKIKIKITIWVIGICLTFSFFYVITKGFDDSNGWLMGELANAEIIEDEYQIIIFGLINHSFNFSDSKVSLSELRSFIGLEVEIGYNSDASRINYIEKDGDI